VTRVSARTLAFAELTPQERYKLLCAVVIPRPIALVTTLARNGVVNAAPFSFFNVFSEDPALVVLGLQHRPDGSLKDTAAAIYRDGVFVVNLVDEALGDAMNLCAVDFPEGESEVEAAGLAVSPGVDVPVPHLSAAPFALECRKTVALSFGPGRELLVGEVLRLHAREGLLDTHAMRIEAAAYHPVGRLFGDLYSRQGDRFALARETHADWLARRSKA
jgi:flavin reductase (DIM6/NTAB) family NADH-FMN oxidoreductase RutF